MERRKFLGLLGCLPFLGLLKGVRENLPQKSSGLTLDKLRQASSLMDQREIHQFMGFRFIRTEGPMQGPPSFDVKQRAEICPDINYAVCITTTVSMNGREPLYYIALWDETENMDNAMLHDKTLAIANTQKYWIRQDRWKRKAQEARWRRNSFA